MHAKQLEAELKERDATIRTLQARIALLERENRTLRQGQGQSHRHGPLTNAKVASEAAAAAAMAVAPSAPPPAPTSMSMDLDENRSPSASPLSTSGDGSTTDEEKDQNHGHDDDPCTSSSDSEGHGDGDGNKSSEGSSDSEGGLSPIHDSDHDDNEGSLTPPPPSKMRRVSPPTPGKYAVAGANGRGLPVMPTMVDGTNAHADLHTNVNVNGNGPAASAHIGEIAKPSTGKLVGRKRTAASVSTGTILTALACVAVFRSGPLSGGSMLTAGTTTVVSSSAGTSTSPAYANSGDTPHSSSRVLTGAAELDAGSAAEGGWAEHLLSFVDRWGYGGRAAGGQQASVAASPPPRPDGRGPVSSALAPYSGTSASSSGSGGRVLLSTHEDDDERQGRSPPQSEPVKLTLKIPKSGGDGTTDDFVNDRENHSDDGSVHGHPDTAAHHHGGMGGGGMGGMHGGQAKLGGGLAVNMSYLLCPEVVQQRRPGGGLVSNHPRGYRGGAHFGSRLDEQPPANATSPSRAVSRVDRGRRRQQQGQGQSQQQHGQRSSGAREQNLRGGGHLSRSGSSPSSSSEQANQGRLAGPAMTASTSVAISKLLLANEAHQAKASSSAPSGATPDARVGSDHPIHSDKHRHAYMNNMNNMDNETDASPDGHDGALVLRDPHMSAESDHHAQMSTARAPNGYIGSSDYDGGHDSSSYVMLLVPSSSLEGYSGQYDAHRDGHASTDAGAPLWVEIGCQMVSARFLYDVKMPI